MNEHVFYEPSLKQDIPEILLNENESTHLLRVLRAKTGTAIMLMNGKGLMAPGIFSHTTKNQAFIEITEIIEYPKAAKTIHLAICPLKKRDKLEWIIEKATEIGVSEISFVNSYHSERSKLNMDRFQKIVISSAKQSMNPYFPIINPIQNFQSFIDQYKEKPILKLLAWCGADQNEYILNHAQRNRNNLILIGPEGDFSAEEINYASGRNFVPVSLGNLRLRSETAALYAISVLHAQSELKNEI
ncbi:RsmE family RNA methyltransferase [Bacteroidota bacterium]